MRYIYIYTHTRNDAEVVGQRNGKVMGKIMEEKKESDLILCHLG